MGVICCKQKSKKSERPKPNPLKTDLKIEDPPLYSDSSYFKPHQKTYYQKRMLEESPPSEPEEPSNIQVLGLIGKGSYGQVLYGKDLSTGDLIAIKQVPLIGLTGSSSVCDEVKILSELKHANIVRYLGSCLKEEFLLIYMEYVSGGTIESLLQKYGPFNENLVKMYTTQVLRGLEYLHYHNIVHRDIKGTNILVTHDGLCKLTDFGSAKNVLGLEGTASVTGTINWMAPEVIKGTGHGRFADIWSLGCLVVEMVTAAPPWVEVGGQVDVILKVINSNDLPVVPDKYSEDLKSFLKVCFNRKPQNRKNVGELLGHKFIAGQTSEVFESESMKYLSTKYISDRNV